LWRWVGDSGGAGDGLLLMRAQLLLLLLLLLLPPCIDDAQNTDRKRCCNGGSRFYSLESFGRQLRIFLHPTNSLGDANGEAFGQHQCQTQCCRSQQSMVID